MSDNGGSLNTGPVDLTINLATMDGYNGQQGQISHCQMLMQQIPPTQCVSQSQNPDYSVNNYENQRTIGPVSLT